MSNSALVFEPEDSFHLSDGRLVFTGRSPWNFQDRSKMEAYMGQSIFILGHLYTIQGFEIQAAPHGPSIGGPIGIVVEPQAGDRGEGGE